MIKCVAARLAGDDLHLFQDEHLGAAFGDKNDAVADSSHTDHLLCIG